MRSEEFKPGAKFRLFPKSKTIYEVSGDIIRDTATNQTMAYYTKSDRSVKFYKSLDFFFVTHNLDSSFNYDELFLVQ